MENLIHSSRRAGSCCQVVVVISDRINAAGNKRAQELGVIFKIIPYENAMNKEAHEAQFTKVIYTNEAIKMRVIDQINIFNL